jgi:hypothetical protein
MVQQRLPLLIFNGLPETDSMVFQLLPPNEKDISTGIFDAALKFVPAVASRFGEDRCGFFKGSFKLTFKAGRHIENGDFENHALNDTHYCSNLSRNRES